MTRTYFLQIFVFGIAVKNAALEVYDNLDRNYIETLKRAFERGGAAAIELLVIDKLEEWKDTEINVAVTGKTGVGKSSFVNAFRGLTAEDEGAAKVGVTETTMIPQPYPHPNNSKLIVWDLPGVGSPNFVRHNYLHDIRGDRFDFFIIIAADRFTEDDLWLAERLQERKKAFYFVRNKIEQDLNNDKRSNKRTHNPTEILKTIRQNSLKYIQNNSNHLGKDTTVYLIDTFDIEKFDFHLLSDRILADAPALKREALTYSITALSEELITSKKNLLLERAHNVAIGSAVAGAIPIPGLDVLVDIGLLLKESEFYLSQFGLDDRSLLRFTKRFGMTVEELQTSLNLKSRLIEFSGKGLLNYAAKLGLQAASSYASSRVLKYILPGFGSIVGAVSSYTMTYHCLESLLNMMEEDALHLHTVSNSMTQRKYLAIN